MAKRNFRAVSRQPNPYLTLRKKLMDEAERICFEEFDNKKLFVLSGVGVKEYYRKLGFKDDGFYLSKTLC